MYAVFALLSFTVVNDDLVYCKSQNKRYSCLNQGPHLNFGCERI
jgi:hypothetical protein